MLRTHPYNTRFQARFQEKLKRIVEESRVLYEKRKQECEEIPFNPPVTNPFATNPLPSETSMQRLMQLITKYNNTPNNRLDRAHIMLEILTFFIEEEPPISTKLLQEKLEEFRQSIHNYRSKQDTMLMIEWHIKQLEDNDQSKHILLASMKEAQLLRAAVLVIYVKIIEKIDVLEVKLKNMY